MKVVIETGSHNAVQGVKVVAVNPEVEVGTNDPLIQVKGELQGC